MLKRKQNKFIPPLKVNKVNEQPILEAGTTSPNKRQKLTLERVSSLTSTELPTSVSCPPENQQRRRKIRIEGIKMASGKIIEVSESTIQAATRLMNSCEDSSVSSEDYHFIQGSDASESTMDMSSSSVLSLADQQEIESCLADFSVLEELEKGAQNF